MIPDSRNFLKFQGGTLDIGADTSHLNPRVYDTSKIVCVAVFNTTKFEIICYITIVTETPFIQT